MRERFNDVNFIQQLTEKPWLPESDGAAALRRRKTFALPKVSLGLRVFLTVATVVFSLVFIAYADRMTFPDWRPLPEPWLLWLNTAILILSSFALQKARSAAEQGRVEVIKSGLLAAGVLAFAFLAGQLVVWQQLVALGYFAAANPANAFFYVVTALHGLHLLGGLVAWGRTSAKVWHARDVAEVHLSVELCAVYWHFLLIIWLAMFGLLLFT
jgi:cytochrome c oxidase subunit 3